MYILDKCNSATGWTVFGDDTVNLSDTLTSTNYRHICGTSAIEFDKANGTANKTYAGAYRTIATPGAYLLNKELSGFYKPWDRICWFSYVSSVSAVASAFVRLGTGVSDYVEFTFPDSALNAGQFTFCNVKIGDAISAGAGCNWEAITYLAMGINFDAETDALADIAVDQIFLATALEMQTDDRT